MSVQTTNDQNDRLAQGRLLCQGCGAERPAWLFRRLSLQGPAAARHYAQECVPCEHLELKDYRDGIVDTPPVDPWAKLIGTHSRKDGQLRGFPSAVARARRQARRTGAPVDPITTRDFLDSLPRDARDDVIAVDLRDPAEGFTLSNLEPIRADSLERATEGVPDGWQHIPAA